jgi:predicted DNA-binding protein YlxM (UPF0122 family)
MKLGEKIKKFDEILNPSLEKFEDLFKIKLPNCYKKNELVEILEPYQGNMRLISIGNNLEIIDLDPRTDGRSQLDSFNGGRNMYKYQAFDLKGNEIASSYGLEEIANKLGICKQTVSSIIKRKGVILDNTGGRKRKDIIIKRTLLTSKEEKSKVVHKRDTFDYVVLKDGKEIGKFRGAMQVCDFLNISKATVSNYINGTTKNKDGYLVKKVKVN